MEDKLDQFLEELKALYEKYELMVDACGCCHSPWVSSTHQHKTVQSAIDHLEEQGIDKN